MIEEVSYVNISFLKPYNLAMDYIEKIYNIQQNVNFLIHFDIIN